MAALKRSLAQESEPASKPQSSATKAKPTRKAAADRRQSNLLLPVDGGGHHPTASRTARATPGRKKA